MTSATDAAEASPRTSPLRVGAALGGIVLAAVVVFGLGVMVGKRVAESLPPATSPPLALPTESLAPQPATPTTAVPPERLTFYDRLSAPAAPAPVALPEATTPASPPAAAQASQNAGEQIKQLAGRGRFAVQVAAVNDRAAAEETAARLKRQGFEVLTVKATVKGKTWYRVRVGSFPSQQAATKAAGLFRSGYGLNAIPVHE